MGRRRETPALDDRHVEAFLEMMAASRGAAKLTIASYGKDLAHLAAFLARQAKAPLEATTADLRRYMKRLGEAGARLPLRPRIARQEGFRLVVVEADEVTERQRQSCFVFEGFEAVGHLVGKISQVLTDVRQHMLTCNPVELDAATSREMGEVHLNLSLNTVAAPRKQRLQLPIDAIATVRLTNKVEHREAVLLRCVTQTTTKLLEEHRQTLRGTQKENRVHVRYVEAFTQHIHSE